MRTLITILLLVLPVTAAAESSRPNILYIFTDDQSDRTVSSYERSRHLVETLNIDKLAQSGVRFRSMYTGTWCMPSRATFLTGLLQYGVESLRMEGEYPGSTYDPEQAPFWLSKFRDAGYTTAQIGKWHVGTDAGFGRDWDYQIVWNRPKHTDNAGNYYYDQRISFNGKPAVVVEGYATDNYTEWAIEYIRGKGRQSEKPWLLWLNYTATHGNFTPAPRHDNTVSEDIDVPMPPGIAGARPGKPAYIQARRDWVQGEDGRWYTHNRPPKGGEWNASVKNYHETALGLDDAVGRLVETLESTGQLQNTLIIYTSDQGFAWGQHGLQHKMAPYDAALASPLIFSWPGVLPEGRVSDTAVSGHDIVPTLFHYAGIELPWPMHGRNISTLIEHPEQYSEHAVLLAYTGRTYGSDTAVLPGPEDLGANGINWWVSYRQHQYKYVMNLVRHEVEELYDLEQDPDELRNLALEKNYMKLVRSFREKTLAELRRTDCPFAEDVAAWFTD